MKDIGIVICNYNKEDYIINCIQSVLNSTVNNFDIFVVDNASTDNSVKKIKEKYADSITLIENKDNLGGSGGFNTGLRETLKYNYKYIMLLDNDIILDKCAIEELYNFIESHPEIGMAGSKVYFMDYPDRIWGYGGNISFNTYKQEDCFKNCTDGESIPEILYCDYVAACSLMARTDAIQTVGLMPEENFIYWDDMEWGYRFNQAGYKVAVCGKSKIWHKAGGRNAQNTFINYYMLRNRIRFFLKNLPKEQRENFGETVLSELFQMIYSCKLKGEVNIITSAMYALYDAIQGITGKAEGHKILPRNNPKDRVEQAVGNAKSVVILFNNDYEGLGNIVRRLERLKTVKEIVVSMGGIDKELDKVKEQFPQCSVEKDYIPEKYEFHMIMCNHIFNDKLELMSDIYIDSWCNIIIGPEDFEYCKNYNNTKKIFMLCTKDALLRS